MSRQTIYITSFRRASRLPDGVSVWSAAVYQPEGFDFPKADWCDIRNGEGQWVRPREFMQEDEPLAAYRQALLALYESRKDEIWSWLKDLRRAPSALVCWCPSDRAAREQLNQFGSFVCHTGVIAEVLSDMKCNVWLDNDRLRMAVLTQRGL